MNPILLTATELIKTTNELGNCVLVERCTMVHPNNVSAIGTEYAMGHAHGFAIIRDSQGKKYNLRKANNTEFFKRFDKVKKAFWIGRYSYEGERWYNDDALLIAAKCMWY
jgi:hypothetical protein